MSAATDTAEPESAVSHDPRLSPLEAAVLDEYKRLRDNLDAVRSITHKRSSMLTHNY